MKACANFDTAHNDGHRHQKWSIDDLKHKTKGQREVMQRVAKGTISDQ